MSDLETEFYQLFSLLDHPDIETAHTALDSLQQWFKDNNVPGKTDIHFNTILAVIEKSNVPFPNKLKKIIVHLDDKDNERYSALNQARTFEGNQPTFSQILNLMSLITQSQRYANVGQKLNEFAHANAECTRENERLLEENAYLREQLALRNQLDPMPEGGFLGNAKSALTRMSLRQPLQDSSRLKPLFS